MADLDAPEGVVGAKQSGGASPLQAAVSRGAIVMMAALEANDLDAAERALESLVEMTGRSADDPDVLLFRVIIAIQRGQAHGALQHLNGLGEDTCPELRVLCLYSLRDPYWEGLAQELAESSTAPAPARSAMAQMLARKAAVMADAGH